MEHKLKSVLSGTGFYLLLGVCLIAAAVSGWYLLFAGDKPVVEEAPPTEAVSAPPADRGAAEGRGADGLLRGPAGLQPHAGGLADP